MLTTVEGSKRFAYDPANRGFLPVFRPGETNRCPGCGRTHWYVGRLSAECGFCGTAIALADTGLTGTGLFRNTFRHAA
ncbi:MAG TPA: hypothetical protein VEW25_06620 [Allosphingosinicella sp.]|nr:hypothetical protein [Allosphingosinicella sp.]